jgi:hypothetical protein
MEKIKLFVDAERLKTENQGFYKAIDCSKEVRDFLSSLGITPTPDKITDFILGKGKWVIDEINNDMKTDLERTSSEITKARIKKDAGIVIATIRDFIESTCEFSEFEKNERLISINSETLKVLPRSGYDEKLKERCTRYVTDFDKYSEFKEVADRINQLAEKHKTDVVLGHLFWIVDGRCVPNPVFNDS